MRKVFYGFLGVLGLCIACSRHPQETCLPSQACPQTCNVSEDCSPGQECNGGFCANPSVSLTAFTLCGIDADCPVGDHCELSACTHQCISTNDCTDGTVCDVRGTCAP